MPAEEARPRSCVRCGQPAYEASRVWIQVHGQVPRQQRGPVEPGQAPLTWQVACPRYRCRRCGAVMTVLPGSAVARKHFSAAAMALALALWGLCGWSAAQVRSAVSDMAGPAGTGRGGWRTLSRWARQLAQGAVLTQLGAPGRGPPSQLAAWAAQALGGRCPLEFRRQGLAHQAFAGACHVSGTSRQPQRLLPSV